MFIVVLILLMLLVARKQVLKQVSLAENCPEKPGGKLKMQQNAGKIFLVCHDFGHDKVVANHFPEFIFFSFGHDILVAKIVA